jgi:regulator of protease activity HflC (stomatin/prohibitin superfamily)
MGEAAAIQAVAEATANAIERIGAAVQNPGGMEALNLKVAEKYISALADMAKENNTMIIPANLADASSLVATAMSVVRAMPAKAGS